MIEEALYDCLTAHTGLATLVGARVYLEQLPMRATLPAVTINQISSGPAQHRGSAAAALVRSRFQFDAWATSHGTARAVAEQVQLALADIAGTVQVDEYLYEVDHGDAFVLDHEGTNIVAGPYIGTRVDVALLANDLDILEEAPQRFRAVVDELIWHTVQVT